jgi:succinate dehydrogenase/fumarate reductase cytochrome b subunit
MNTSVVSLPKPETGVFYLIHTTSSKIVGVFVVFHLLNHLFALGGPELHIQVMESFRKVYRNELVEYVLLFSCACQVVSGLAMALKKRKSATEFFDRLQLWSGLYIALFLMIHLSAVLVLARIRMQVDSNFYFAAAGLQQLPSSMFFIPYYSLSVLSVGAHIACSFRKLARKKWNLRVANRIAWIIIGISAIATIGIMLSFSGVLYAIDLPG